MILWFADAAKTFDLTFVQVWKWLTSHYNNMRKTKAPKYDFEKKDSKTDIESEQRKKKKKKKKKMKMERLQAALALLTSTKKKKKKTDTTASGSDSSSPDSSDTDSDSDSGKRKRGGGTKITDLTTDDATKRGSRIRQPTKKVREAARTKKRKAEVSEEDADPLEIVVPAFCKNEVPIACTPSRTLFVARNMK
jgi:hypothetical protein